MRTSLIGEVLEMDHDDLNRLVEVIKSRRSELTTRASLQFSPGDRVYFVRQRGKSVGQRVTGEIVRRLRKNISMRADVECGGGLWTVHPTLLKKED